MPTPTSPLTTDDRAHSWADLGRRELRLMERHTMGLRPAGASVVTIGTTVTSSGSLGTGASVAPLASVLTTTAAVANSDGIFRTSASQASFADRPRTMIYFTPQVAANQRILIGMSSNSAPSADTFAATHCVYMRASSSAGDTTWKLVTADGTAGNVVDTGVAFSGNPWAFFYDCGKPGIARVLMWEYVSGTGWVFRAEISTTANVPRARNDVAQFSAGIWCRTLDAVSKVIAMHSIDVMYGEELPLPPTGG